MRAFCLMVAACVVACLPGWAADKGQASNAEKIIGTWEVTQSKDIPPGTTVEYTRRGTFKMTGKADGKTFTFEGSYKVEGSRLTVTEKEPGQKDRTEAVKIKALTDKELVTETDNGKMIGFTRKK